MNIYHIYFEIYGKKMKAKIIDESEAKAKQQLKGKIVFHKIEKQKDGLAAALKMFEDFFKV